MPFEKKMPLPFFTQVNSNMPVIGSSSYNPKLSVFGLVGDHLASWKWHCHSNRI